MFHLLFERFENVSGNAANGAFCINQEQPYFPGLCPGKIKNPDAAALAAPFAAPANLTNPAGTPHHCTCIGVGCKERLKDAVFFVGQVIVNLAL